MIYNRKLNGQEGWLIAEEEFNELHLGKTESIFCIGNGYLGARASNEEEYQKTVRNIFINGTFNKFSHNEVTELPNLNDIFEFEFYINGELFSLLKGEIKDYEKQLNLKTGEVTRKVVWIHNDIELGFEFRRFSSLDKLNVICQNIKITASEEIDLKFISGINGQVTNSGAQHFEEIEQRFFNDMEDMVYSQKTIESGIEVVTGSSIVTNPKLPSEIGMGRRKVFKTFTGKVNEIEITKYNVFNTSRDRQCEKLNHHEIQGKTLRELGGIKSDSYEQLLTASALKWEEFWGGMDIEIEGDGYALLAYRFAMYHMRVFTPYHDERMNCGAKGLSGEGYKGHTFWDTEIFILPVYAFTNPEVAKNLLIYRYLGLDGARRKADEYGCKGAQYPWEAAWINDGEVTPLWGAPDVVTGKATKIWSGILELHITSDVAYGIWLYYQITKDQEFMDKYGYEMIFEIANYWSSRGQLVDGEYHINDVIGPDEYKEHVNNNAFTNYMAKWCCELAIEYSEKADGLDKYLHVDQWKEFANKIHLQKPTEEGILPQDDTYLSLEEIDLTKYKNQAHVAGIFDDLSLDQINKVQVSKQADVVVLNFILEHLFNYEIKENSFRYYEPRTLHDSSLSLSTHSIVANDLGLKDIADDLFEKSLDIDMGPFMKTSDHGIHAASLAGIWQSIIYGYGGVRLVGDCLRIEPKINDKWNKLSFNITFNQVLLSITITKDEFIVERVSGDNELRFFNNGVEYILDSRVVIKNT